MILEYYCLPHCEDKPARANPSDAGLDLCFNPKDGQSFWIEPGESKILSTGLKFGIPHGYMLQIMNRSSIAAKRSLVVGAHVVDAGYNGEVFINLHNIGKQKRVIEPGDRIAQAVLVPVIHAAPVEHYEDELYSRAYIESNRGDGALGSTDA